MTAFANTLIPLFGVPFGGATPSTAILDASGDRIGGISLADRAGSIDRIAVYTMSVNGTPPSYAVRLESSSNGLPSGSLIAANTSGSFTPTAATLHLVSLTAAYSVAKDELVATTLQSASADGSNNATFNARIPLGSFGQGLTMYHPRYVRDLSVGTWAADSLLPCVVPVYSDGTFMQQAVPQSASASASFNSSSTPDEIGVRWTQVGNLRASGGVLYMRYIAASSDYDVHLYRVADGDSASPVATATRPYATYNRGTSLTGVMPFYFSSAYELVDGADYRLTMVPTTTNNITHFKLTYGSAAQRAAMSHSYYTSRTRTADGNAGTWTDDDASVVECFAPVGDQSVASAGGGSLVIGSLSGGIHQ